MSKNIEINFDGRVAEILSSSATPKIDGNTYYVSADGCDSFDGLSPETPWKTTERVSSADLHSGDGVLFRRGDVFRGQTLCHEGVTYSAYGEGDKPKIYGWKENLASPELWECVDSCHHIWKYKDKILDCGTLVFGDDEQHSVKLIPSYLNGEFVCRDDEGKPFRMEEEMVRNLDIYWHFDSILTTEPSRGETFPVPQVDSSSFGELYLRCDEGNPGELFTSIEAVPKLCAFRVGNNKNVTIDNFCMKYLGLHAVAAGGICVENLTVKNCEIGWIGGTIQHYLGTDPNYPEGGRGTVTRFGNGVEVYGGCKNFQVSNCYIYEIYDAGATHQINTNGNKYMLENVIYSDNVFDKCVYGIEYFLDMTDGDRESLMKNIKIHGNIICNSGYGWGQQRHNKNTPALIKGWSYVNAAEDFEIWDNIFSRSAYRMLHLVAESSDSCPKMQGNTYIQDLGGCLGQYGGKENGEPPILPFDEMAEKTINETLGDKDAKVVILKGE